jgi:hypothetical protein
MSCQDSTQQAIQLYGSVLVPSAKLLAAMRFRPWGGVFLRQATWQAGGMYAPAALLLPGYPADSNNHVLRFKPARSDGIVMLRMLQ